MFDIEENLKKLPAKPGVYIHRDSLGQVIYVGKAISLRNRVRQYFRASGQRDPKVRAMVSHIAEFEYIVCGSEMEAFILENTLIKKYMPQYNILLRDDKTYPYIKVTAADDFPRVLKTRIIGKDGSKYFGPYSDAGAVNSIVELLSSIYKLKQCAKTVFPDNWRPCLNYHIGRCDGVCIGNVSKEEYAGRIRSALEFLNGRDRDIEDYLEKKMNAASARLDYEEAARYRDYLLACRALGEKQRVVMKTDKDMDVVMYAGRGFIVQFFVRGGKLTGRETFKMDVSETDTASSVISEFLKQHYSMQTGGPGEILVKTMPDEAGLIEQYLGGLWGRRVRIVKPERGEKRALLDLATKDVAEMTDTIEDREKSRRERSDALGAEIRSILALTGETAEYDGRPYRVEAYDISNMNGVDTVGAMVVFDGLRPDKKSYRRFRIRTVDGQDDYAAMQEVVYRRFRRAEKGDPAFAKMPDALLIDGGRGHVNAVLQVTDALGLSVPVLGMAKDDSHRTRALVLRRRGGEGEDAFIEEDLKEHPMLFRYLGTVQEEVHRFAIEYHRNVRGKRALVSVLDEIEGIGPVKRNALFARFGSIENMREASVAELAEVDGITEELAGRVHAFLEERSGGNGSGS
ncbi:MAG: excinuclease ABC subunit UvrC [Anaerovoracaceae bacterium]|nr:excinuclease ABC subunit UvrC [Anaerovoracaceae bacterium]